MIEIVNAGVATTFQDVGRPGLAHVGVPASGAVDPVLAALVNRLVGNDRSAALIETCGALTIAARDHVVVASSSELAPVGLGPGETYTLAPGPHGRLWHYLAIRGGFDVDSVLGSRSCDTLSGLGPPVPAAGSSVGVGRAVVEPIVVDQAPLAELRSVARVAPGPRRDWFTDSSWSRLVRAPWSVTAASRVGVRLAGPPLTRWVAGELASEGLVRGAIQVPPSGELVMMSSDHPTTGGYPVIGVVHPDDVAIVAQHAVGSTMRFRSI